MSTTTIESPLSPLALLLRRPREVVRRCLEEEGLRPLALGSLAALLVGSTAFGAVVGSFRGGEQIAYAALKVPAALLSALVLCIPAFFALTATLGRPLPMRTVVALTLAASGRAALVLLAFAPILWLALDFGLGYHAAALASTVVYGLAGLAALGVLLRGAGSTKHAILTAGAFVLVFLAAGGQTGWILRPYLVRPQTEDVPLVRSVEGGFADALLRSSRSAVGIYDVAERDLSRVEQQMESRRGAYDDPNVPAWREPVVTPAVEADPYEPPSQDPNDGWSAP
ncbi:MAG: hypothetical protein AB7S26_20105 [Sandaracinaceae bacterium]